MNGRKNRNIIVGLAWYRPQDWSRLLEVSEDRAELESSHGEWRDHANKLIRQMEKQGVRVRRVIIDLDELLAWCRKRGVAVDGAARADFVSEKVRQED